ncbi:MAG: LTA synthase family protein [Bacteroidia bacterium]
MSFVLWSVQQFTKSKQLHLANLIYNFILIILCVILAVGNIRLYGEWGTLVGDRAFNYLKYPEEAFASESTMNIVIFILVIITSSVLLFLLFKRMCFNFSHVFENGKKKIATICSMPIVLVFLIRGGFQLAPINESSAYYSLHTINNHIATNQVWYFTHSLIDAESSRNPFVFMDNSEAEKLFNELKQKSADTTTLNLKTPNVVFIILESWTADVVKELGGLENVTPSFSELSKQGLLFTSCYSSGYRTEQSLVSILSGFPAQPKHSIISTPEKSQKLPAISLDLKDKNYATLFFYGGETEFANMKSYLLNKGFEKIVEKKDFEKNEMSSKWGAHDEYVFRKMSERLKSEKEPFLSCLLTLSSHEPFQVPIATPFSNKSDPEGFKREEFKSAIWYSDKCLGQFFEMSKNDNWFSNTLFVLVADHGHWLPLLRNMNYSHSRKIPLLIFGEVLPNHLKGKKVETITSQHDIPAILLSLLNIPSEHYLFSKNTINSSNGYAYYSNEEVLGWISKNDTCIYSFANKQMIKGDSTSLGLKQSKAFLQTLYNTYLNY